MPRVQNVSFHDFTNIRHNDAACNDLARRLRLLPDLNMTLNCPECRGIDTLSLVTDATRADGHREQAGVLG